MGDLNDLVGLNVWAESQESLEQQALHELNVFTEQSQNENLEDGEIPDARSEAKPVMLDLNSYIKRQEDLRKRQEHKRSLQVSERSKKAAELVSKHTSDFRVKKRKGDQDAKANKKLRNSDVGGEDEGSSKPQTSSEENGSGSEYVPSDDYDSGNI